MSFEEEVVAQQQPGLLIDVALAKTTNAAVRAMMRASEENRPLTEGVTYKLPICQDLTDIAIRTFPEHDTFQNLRRAYMVGVQCAYNVVQLSPIIQPPYFSEGTPGQDQIIPQMRATKILRAAREYGNRSMMAQEIVEDCYPFLDPAEMHPRLVRAGILSGFFLADIGERQRELEIATRLRDFYTAQARAAEERQAMRRAQQYLHSFDALTDDQIPGDE